MFGKSRHTEADANQARQVVAAEEATRRWWEDALKTPADGQIEPFLKEAGITVPLVSVLGASCSFWAKRPNEYYATACLSQVTNVMLIGSILLINIAGGPLANVARSAQISHRNGLWQCRTFTEDSSVMHDILQFKLLPKQ